MSKEWFTASFIAGMPGVPKTESGVKRKAKKNGWESRRRAGKGGGIEYSINSLSELTQAALLTKLEKETKTIDEEHQKKTNESLWIMAQKRTDQQREIGFERAAILHQVLKLKKQMKMPILKSIRTVAEANNLKYGTVRNWYYGASGRPWEGAKNHPKADWPALLTPKHTGRITAQNYEEAWEYFKSHWLHRRQPSVTDSYRRMVEVANEKGWQIPTERKIRLRISREIPQTTIVLQREGPIALNRMYPSLRMDKTCFHAGQAVSGDGVKFDKLYIDWGDEILKTTTAWVWKDIYSGKILAHRVAKTENTDVFRLATYDLTAVCLPEYVQIDNTRVAANKAMTGRSFSRRNRFRDKENDPVGLLEQLGMHVHFTNPDQETSNPGVKPIERDFGIGGIHSEVTTNPKLIDRGHSKATAIPVDEFITIVAEEVSRFNARKKRRSDVCRGLLSYDDAFNESYAKSTVRTATKTQRRLLLLMQEVVHASKRSGTITLKAGAANGQKHRYWCQELSEFRGQDLVAFYDPENLEKPVSLHTIKGQYIADADRITQSMFNDTATAREWNKIKRRNHQSAKKIAAEETRMTAMQRKNLYPEAPDIDVPPPGVVQGHFGQKNKVNEETELMNKPLFQKAAGAAAEDSAELAVMDENFSASMAQLRKKRDEEI
ncbi:MAG TPA: hypothetical protein ENK06_13120 [Gammaproteobacteria bacterium]|nr:hypothetical protein [Gammaproteobacteria bacterium]